MSTVTDLDRQSNEDSLSPRSRMLVLVVAFAALVFDGVELGWMPVASLSVSQSLLGDDYTPTLGGDWFARFTAALMLGAAIGGIALGSLGVGVLLAGFLFSALGGDYSRVGAICALVYVLGFVVIWFAPDTRSSNF